ncbi:hypothetical protein TrRE_jg2473 [Triparma retinervis]|uniref:Mitochondrial inner membrane protease ATP23 n=1 Tax=Triparma retinervis TaxID=2557542 RepID=A0A9W7E6E4_9STRA|nr:hypothetical protein TrRE_jg2473 [Triparma retinervis]
MPETPSACQTLCQSWKEKLSYRSKTVEFLLNNLEENGCTFNYFDLIQCRECTRLGMGGGFALNTGSVSASSGLPKSDPTTNSSPLVFGGDPSLPPSPSVVVCSNRVRDYAEFEQTVTHELIHAVDQCRVKDADFRNLQKHACTEVRASNLSGECGMGTEAMRGNVNFKGGQITCVKRRAGLSVKANTNCKDGETAREAVEGVFGVCYKDTYPFMRHPKL